MVEIALVQKVFIGSFRIHQSYINATVDADSRTDNLCAFNKTTDHVMAWLDIVKLKVKICVGSSWLRHYVLKFLVGQLLSHDQSSVGQLSTVISFSFQLPPARLGQGHRQLTPNGVKIEVMSGPPLEPGLPVEVVGVVVDPADIDHHKELLKIFPKHEESSIIFIRIP